jgi:hypothetical protein
MDNRTNMFEIGFQGDPAPVLEKLDGKCEVVEQHESG